MGDRYPQQGHELQVSWEAEPVYQSPSVCSWAQSEAFNAKSAAHQNHRVILKENFTRRMVSTACFHLVIFFWGGVAGPSKPQHEGYLDQLQGSPMDYPTLLGDLPCTPRQEVHSDETDVQQHDTLGCL